MVRVTIRVSSLLAAATLVGCGGAELFRAHRVERQHEAGSIHFAVMSVAPWRDYVDALQPDFELDELQALGMVVPSTRGIEESAIDVWQGSGGVQAGVDPTAVLRETTRSSVEDDGTEVTETTREEKGPDDPGVAAPMAIANPQDRVAGSPNPSVLDRQAASGEDMDPMLRYSAATALLQEVRLLNRYVRDAAVRQGFRPYVVRMQITLMPLARNSPYDAYSTLSFFTERPEDPRGEERSGPSLVSIRGDGKTAAALRRTPQIVPLLATDNLEATTHSRTVENLRQIAAAAAFMSGSITGSAGVQRFTKDLQGVLGRDTNSLLTVARVSDNTLRVRLGAMQQAASDFAMVPRNNFVTLLVMVPEDTPPTIEVVAKTTMVDAETGIALAERTDAEIVAVVRRVTDEYGFASVDDGALHELLSLAQANDQKAFFERLGSLAPEAARRGPSLWLDLVSMSVGGQFSATEFDLPDEASHFDRTALRTGDHVLLFDDPSAGAWCALPPDAFDPRWDPAPILELPLPPAEGEEDGPSSAVPVRAERIERTATGDLILHFPSPAAWGLAGSGDAELRLVVFPAGDGGEDSDIVFAVRRVVRPTGSAGPASDGR